MATDDLLTALRAEVARFTRENKLLRAAQQSDAATAWAKVERHLVTEERDSLLQQRRNWQKLEAETYMPIAEEARSLRAEAERLRFALSMGDELSRKSVKEIVRLRDEVVRLTREGKESQEAIRVTAETAADWMRVSIGRVATLVDLIAFLTEALGGAATEAHVRCLGCDREPFTACRDEHCRTVALAWVKSREWCAKVKAWSWT